MNQRLKDKVRLRAGFRCEYCLVPEAAIATTAPIDHIRAKQHRGRSTFDNLALSCLQCNSRKGPNLSGIDPKSGRVIALFNPRFDRWLDHFRWDGARIVGMTSVGRATVSTLGFNDAVVLAARRSLIEEGWFDDVI